MSCTLYVLILILLTMQSMFCKSFYTVKAIEYICNQNLYFAYIAEHILHAEPNLQIMFCMQSQICRTCPASLFCAEHIWGWWGSAEFPEIAEWRQRDSIAGQLDYCFLPQRTLMNGETKEMENISLLFILLQTR